MTETIIIMVLLFLMISFVIYSIRDQIEQMYQDLSIKFAEPWQKPVENDAAKAE